MNKAEKKRFRILVGYDGSNASKEAVEVGKKHARAFDAKIYVVTCLEGSNASLEEVKQSEGELDGIKAVLDEAGIVNETHLLVRDETPGEGLVKFASDKEIDQIVIGVKRRSRVGKFLVGSTCRYVTLEAPCPVVTVK